MKSSGLHQKGGLLIGQGGEGRQRGLMRGGGRGEASPGRCGWEWGGMRELEKSQRRLSNSRDASAKGKGQLEAKVSSMISARSHMTLGSQ